MFRINVNLILMCDDRIIETHNRIADYKDGKDAGWVFHMLKSMVSFMQPKNEQ